MPPRDYESAVGRDSAGDPSDSLAEIDQVLGAAIELLQSGRYREFGAQFEAFDRQLSALLTRRKSRRHLSPLTAESAGHCHQLRRNIYVLSGLLGHVSGVFAGLAEIRHAAAGCYGPAGRYESPPASRLELEG